MIERNQGKDVPPEHRLGLWIRPRWLALFAALAALVLGAAWLEYLVCGLPSVPLSPRIDPATAHDPQGFPLWLRLGHYVNLLFMVLLVRSGLQILADHPRLYWNVHSALDSEWLRVTPIVVPRDRLWTAKDDARYLSPWIGLPGYRHTVGMARHWHFASALFWSANGVAFVLLLFGTNQWKRLVPMSWHIVSDAWAIFVHYATFHLPVEPDGFYRYNPLQQLAYFGVVFFMAPMSILTGLSMSPAIANRFRWYPRIFGNRQTGRSIHFLLLCGYLGFVFMHVLMVAVTGLKRNMNHIVIGSDDADSVGLAIGLVGIGAVAALCWLAHWLAWNRPRAVQRVSRALVSSVMGVFLDHFKPRSLYTREEISPYLWPNGKLPTSDAWKTLAADQFKNYRLRVHGLVENPVELSLAEIEAMGKHEQITMHNCIQGWSGIAEWGGLEMWKLIELVRPKPEAQAAVFHSYGGGIYGGTYYDCHSIRYLKHPQSLLAYEMNYEPLNDVHGAPLRLRVENQLGFKQVKWIERIEFVESESSVGQGEGGYNEDHEYFGYMADL